MYMTSNKVGRFVSTINFLWIMHATKRSSLLIFDILFSMLMLDVQYIELFCEMRWMFCTSKILRIAFSVIDV